MMLIIPKGNTTAPLPSLLIPVYSEVRMYTQAPLVYKNCVVITVFKNNKDYYAVLPNQCPGDLYITLRKPKMRERIKMWLKKQI